MFRAARTYIHIATQSGGGYGGSFRVYGGSFRAYGGSFRACGSSLRACGGSFRSHQDWLGGRAGSRYGLDNYHQFGA